MPRLSSLLVAGVALAVMGGIIASATRPAVAGDNGQKTAADPKTTTAADPAAANSAPSPFAPEALQASADEKAIRATADDFVKAFNAADAKAIGAQWATDAQYTDESGESFHGRVAIEKEYADLFNQHRSATISVAIESIRFFGPDIAIEKGIAKIKLLSPEAHMAARYTVVHAKRDGQWVMVVGRDAPYVPGLEKDYLKDLEWLIGEWVMEGKEGGLRLKFEWMAQRNFIKNTFVVNKADGAELTGGQIIGWNPKLGRIVSWHFDAQGGFGNDAWTKDGPKWMIEASGTFRDGSQSSAVNILTPVDANAFTWQSVHRTLDGVNLPNTPPVKIVRVKSGK
jgi:uncharacterized protein (TIGR02246 family)